METDVEKAIQKDLKKIEAKYGTKMKNICSARLQKILEFESGLLPKLMEKFFSSYFCHYYYRKNGKMPVFAERC